MIKRSVSLLIVFTLLFSSFVFAEEEILTVEKAVELATEDQSAIEDINDGIEKLWDGYNAAKDGKKQVESTLSTLDRFEDLYNKKYVDKDTLDAFETAELEGYQMAFGDEPPHYTGQQMLDNFIRTRDLTWKSLYGDIQKTKNTRTTIMPSIEKGVKELYINIVALQTTLAQQETYLSISQTQHDQLVIQHGLGQVSDADLKNSEQNLLILEKQTQQLGIQVANLEMSLNQLMDVPVTAKYTLVDTVESLEIEANHKTLDEYLDAAIINRTEMKNARIDLEIKEREDSIISQYLKNDLITDRVNADIAVITARHALEQAEADVIDDISDGYISMMTYWNDYQLSLQSLEIAKKNLSDIEKRLELGQVTQTTVDLTAFSVLTAENTVKSNIRNYQNAVDKMESASGNGPAYGGK
ncbi:TolC family protein [Acidaminobacter sp. JC074]|uniref:TolC family protein n=1 Tax=Acidaminobacter sp. JC074 TaxID=2530199 RepID=UPI001F0FE7AF|nr:TolC family protein [Acidaminobacter sp. JC074]